MLMFMLMTSETSRIQWPHPMSWPNSNGLGIVSVALGAEHELDTKSLSAQKAFAGISPMLGLIRPWGQGAASGSTNSLFRASPPNEPKPTFVFGGVAIRAPPESL